MTAEEIYSQLYERMLAEQDKYRDWLLTQSPEEVLNHCYEYAMREDILMVFESSEIDEKHARVLLENDRQLVSGENRARGIVRIRQDEHLGAGRDAVQKLLGGQLKIVFCLGFNNDGLATAQSGNGLVANVTGLGDDNFITGGSNGADAGVNGLRAANGYKNFTLWVIGNVVFSFNVAPNLLAEHFKTAVGRVARFAALERENARFADLPRGGEIGFTNTKGNDVFHCAGNIKEFTNARGLDTNDCGGE